VRFLEINPNRPQIPRCLIPPASARALAPHLASVRHLFVPGLLRCGSCLRLVSTWLAKGVKNEFYAAGETQFVEDVKDVVSNGMLT
jgi:hypothetical protein